MVSLGLDFLSCLANSLDCSKTRSLIKKQLLFYAEISNAVSLEYEGRFGRVDLGLADEI